MVFMDLLYQKDSYLREFLAEITEVDSAKNAVLLNRTAFFPGGGGQPNDVGWLHTQGQEYQVTSVKKEGSAIWHVLKTDLPDSGEAVKGIIDWDRRYKLMRTHTAFHILCGVIWRDYGAQVTGGNMEPLKGRMDFEFERLNSELTKEIELKVNTEVKEKRPVSVKILPREEAFKIPDLIRTKINLLPENIQEVRIVEIEGLDIQADGGTHVAQTGEVGQIKITDYKSKGKINKRIYMELL
jgi:misacylated tRNA(Ala) deacylase